VGTSSTLFTTHKGAYFDGRKGPGRFSVDHVGNCLEVFLKSFHLADDKTEDTKQDKKKAAPAGKEKIKRYYAVLRSGESVRTTPAYVKPPSTWDYVPPHLKKDKEIPNKSPWSQVIRDLDTKTVNVMHKLYVPLPADYQTRDYLEIELWSIDDFQHDLKPMTFAEATSVPYAGGKEAYNTEQIGAAQLHLDRLSVGDERTLDNLRMGKLALTGDGPSTMHSRVP
jgi:hypothetical protein